MNTDTLHPGSAPGPANEDRTLIHFFERENRARHRLGLIALIAAAAFAAAAVILAINGMRSRAVITEAVVQDPSMVTRVDERVAISITEGANSERLRSVAAGAAVAALTDNSDNARNVQRSISKSLLASESFQTRIANTAQSIVAPVEQRLANLEGSFLTRNQTWIGAETAWKQEQDIQNGRLTELEQDLVKLTTDLSTLRQIVEDASITQTSNTKNLDGHIERTHSNLIEHDRGLKREFIRIERELNALRAALTALRKPSAAVDPRAVVSPAADEIR